MRMDPMRIFTSSMHELLGITILPLHRMYNNMPPLLQPQCILRELAFPAFGKAECQSFENVLRWSRG
jgi:hypothetical protein